MRCLSEQGDLREAAANFFRMLRELDAENLDLIVAERVPEEGIGAAINDVDCDARRRISRQSQTVRQSEIPFRNVKGQLPRGSFDFARDDQLWWTAPCY